MQMQSRQMQSLELRQSQTSLEQMVEELVAASVHPACSNLSVETHEIQMDAAGGFAEQQEETHLKRVVEDEHLKIAIGMDVDDLSLSDLLARMEETESDLNLFTHGYQRVEKMRDILQGVMMKAKVVNSQCENAEIGDAVCIKKVSKKLANSNIAIRDDLTFVVQQDIEKESRILRHISEHQPIGQYVVKYVDFFESDTDYFLVMEHIDGISLRQFVKQAHELMATQALSMNNYTKAVKFIMWQLVTTLHSLHSLFHVCHLDLCLDAIMLKNANFVKASDGSIQIDSNIMIKLCDLGVSEMFAMPQCEKEAETAFDCLKTDLSIDHGLLCAPATYFGEMYDARATDMYSVGMILYECMTNTTLYQPADLWDTFDGEPLQPQMNGYQALMANKLKQYVTCNNLHRHFKAKAFRFLNALLQVDEQKRLTSADAIHHVWFSSYYAAYESTLNKRFKATEKRLQATYQSGQMKSFPFYEMSE
eukprot:CAMPEP_0197024596 /NCGR_PEP_ID=MMETSP1384-20130603/5111_1 /TAXON_ID=29189 /ORGANISM="Ammonia sp." /LENGTH=477 /DNA_ID=CAMNT_0042453005 /DNA_START=74 /DNA_END=1507 /DNA_ORIENTATION=+